MNHKWILVNWISIICVISTVKACFFYSKRGLESETTEGVRFIRVREDMHIGSEILTLRAYPRATVKLKGVDRSLDHRYFKLRELNDTYIQVLLDKSLDDLVDRDVPQNLLKFKIECTGKNGQSDETSHLGVTVYIEDINDHYPVFQNLPYLVNVDESTSVGTTIYQGISAFDRDKPNTPNSDVQYSIGPHDFGSGGPYFSLESPHRPSVILRRELDYDEGIRKFDLPIIASDRGTTPNSSNTTLTIFVLDSDDLPPKFTEGVYRTKIREFSPLTGKPIHVLLHFNPPIEAFDQDSLNATLVYDIISGNERNLFSVDSETGMIYLKHEIDLEEESLPGNTFVLQLEVRQKDNPRRRAIARVEIEIVDLNDNAPEFEVDFYNISIVENLPSGFSVLQVNAIDRDQGENSEFHYAIVKEEPPGAFVIDPRTGWITVRDQELLDREARTSITMTIQAIEKQPPHDLRDIQSGMVQVEIFLLDSNDNTPQFEMGNLYEFKVDVNAPVGHIIGYVTATDPDEGRNGMILYEMQHPRGSGMIPFKLDSNSGALTVSGPLRRGRIAVFVEASDQPANPSERRFSLAVVTIEIVAQLFDGTIDFVGAPYEFWVGTDVSVGASIGQIRTNLDWELQGEVMYDLLHSYSEGVPFAVEERSGIVTVIRNLEDFDRTFYEFEAVAAHESFDSPRSQLIRRTSKSEQQITDNGEVIEIDEGTISDSENVLLTNVTIHVVGSDDERGIFTRGTYADPIVFHIKENLPGALIGQLLYKNMSRDSKIQPKPVQAVLAKGKEMFSSKNFRDSKYLRNSTTDKLTAPKSKRRNRDANSETAYIVSVTPTVEFDDDLMAEETMLPERFMLPLRRKFKPKVKEVDTSKHTQYEKRTTYDSRSKEKAPENFETYVQRKFIKPVVEVTDSDDLENDPIDSTPDNDQSEANIKNSAKTIHTTVTKAAKEVIITPRPVTRSPKQRKLIVLPQNGTQTLPNPSHGVRFVIANQQDVADFIAITENGTLLTVQGLDRETRDVYKLIVIAEYSKRFVSGAGIYQVTIHVDDVNDNPPKFNHPSYKGTISENSPPGTVISLNQMMLIKDADLGENAEFSVILSGDGSALFSVDYVNKTETNTGNRTEPLRQSLRGNGRPFQRTSTTESTILKSMDMPFFSIRFTGSIPLDRELESVYNLRIIAKDNGGLKSDAKLQIIILDVNDNSPMFERIAVFRNSGIKILEYTNYMEIYFVDHFTADHSVTLPLKQALNPSPITYGISMQSHQIMPMSNRTISIGTPRSGDNSTDLNLISRKAKRHNRSLPYFSIPENGEVGSSIIKVTAIDEDADENARVFYDIASETFIPNKVTPNRIHIMKFFGIDRYSGEIKINKPLQAESEIRLNISAKDIGGLSDYLTIRFKVLDINDHPPVFEKSWYTFDIDEGSYTSHLLGKITATDEDHGNNSYVTYNLQSDKPIPFKILQTTGELYVTNDLDREVVSKYEFKIIASDNSQDEMKLTSVAEVEVNVLDINDNAPEFTGYDEIYYPRSFVDIENIGRNTKIANKSELNYDQESLPVYKAYLNKNTEPGTFVKQVSAIDKDFAGNGNGLVMFALQHNSLPYFFEIDSRDGIITTVSKFTRFYGYEHLNLTIIASDLGSPSRSSTALLLVNLQGEDLFEEDDSNRLFSHKYYEVEVKENNPVPTFVIQLNTTSMHKDETLKWSIVPEMDMVRHDEFKINSKNGSLWLTKSLDREHRDLYKLKIRADRILREGRNNPIVTYPVSGDRIQGLLDNEVRVVVKVMDENDNEPVFAGNGKPIIAVMSSTANFGYPVTRVEATDADIGINSDIRYSLLNEPSRLFGIDSITGWIRVLGPISGNQRVYGFDVKATDRRGADDGRSSIANVFVYVLGEDKQVHLVLGGQPVEVEKDIDDLLQVLNDMTKLDIRVRMIEPHPNDSIEPATDVYVYAVDPRSNSVIDMEALQNTLSSIEKNNISTSTQILEIAQLGSHRYDRRNLYGNSEGPLRTPELASIILAMVVFAGGLSTALCVICVRYKRHRRNSSNGSGLTYSLSGTPSTLRTGSTKQMLGIPSNSHLYTDTDHLTKDRHHDRREYIDVPLPQSVLSAAFMDHDSGCLRYNQIHNPTQTITAETPATSLQSSGRDSGLDLSRERSDGSSKKVFRFLRESQRRERGELKRKKCTCGQGEIHGCSGGESSDSYEDSLKNMKVCRRTSLPKTPGFRRSVRINPIGKRGLRHSFSGNQNYFPLEPRLYRCTSGFHDDLLQNSPGPLGRQRLSFAAKPSMTDLEERLRNLERTFQQPFHLNNSRH